MKLATPMAAALLLSACIGARSPDPVRYFVLDPEPGTSAVPYAGPPVVVAPTTAAGFYGTTQIVYSDMPGVRARYRYSFWTERPQQLIQRQLQARLQGAGADSGLVVDTHLDEIYHDASSTPGVVLVTVTASLRDVSRHELLASHRFTRSAPATAYDARGAVAGMRKAVGAVLDDIVRWVQANAAPS
jgi:ABC-type uncharacterized transport system auxiliary subunit